LSSANRPFLSSFQTSSSDSCLKIRTRIGDSFAIFFSSMSAIIRSESGCMWRPLTAGVPSVLQPASAIAAAIAADAKSARTKGRRFNRRSPQPLGFPKPFPAQSLPRTKTRRKASRIAD
jgi:hypothetical protein